MTLPRDRLHGLAAVAALVLLVLALLLLAATERQVTKVARIYDGMGGELLDLGSRAPGPEVDGHLVRVTGTTAVTRLAADPQFGVTAAAPLLRRQVEMLQWQETTYGGGAPQYAVRWIDHPVDSSRFQRPQGHANPPEFPFGSDRFEAGEVRLGHFVLSRALVRTIAGSEALAVDLASLPANLAASLQQDGDGLTTAANPRSPRVGDLRIRWSMVPNQELTILARASHGRLEPAPFLPAPGYVVMLGDMPMMGLMPGQARPPDYPWLLRVLVAGLMLAAAWLLLAALDEAWRVDWIAWPALAVVPFALAEIVLWWGVRTGVLVVCLLLLLAAGGGLYWRLLKR